MTLPATSLLGTLSEDLLATFRARLVAHGYDSAIVSEAEASCATPVRHARAPIVRWWLSQKAEPRAALARLFAFEDALAEASVAELLGAELVDALVRAAVLVRSEGALRAAYLLYPMEDGPFVLSDFLWSGGDAVMGPGAGTAFVARMIPKGGSLLDVGCGAGSLALCAALRGASRAVGVDINPRAIEIARWNARLNGVQAEFLAGDLTRPVAGQRFDRVVAQPAFVSRPEGQGGITYLHGGARGDELALRLLGEIPAVLADGGRALVFFQSPAQAGTSMSGRIRDAVGPAAAELDLLALRTDGAPPALQAMVFASYEVAELDASYQTAVRRYLDHFEAIGTRSVEGILAVVSRRKGAGRRYAIALPFESSHIPEAELEALLARLELSGQDDATLLRARLRVTPGATLVTEQGGVGAAAASRLTLRFPARSLAIPGEIDEQQLERLRAFEAGATVEEAVGHAGLPFVREALVRGRLVLD